MRYGNDDQAAQPEIEQERKERRRRIQLRLMPPRELVATYKRVGRENVDLLKTVTSGLPLNRAEMIDAIMKIEKARDADQ